MISQTISTSLPQFVPYESYSNDLGSGFLPDSISEIQTIWNQTIAESSAKSLVPFSQFPQCTFCAKFIENEAHQCTTTISLPSEDLSLPMIELCAFLLCAIGQTFGCVQLGTKPNTTTSALESLSCVPCGSYAVTEFPNYSFPSSEMPSCFELGTANEPEPETPPQLPERCEKLSICFSPVVLEQITLLGASIIINTNILCFIAAAAAEAIRNIVRIVRSVVSALSTSLPLQEQQLLAAKLLSHQGRVPIVPVPLIRILGLTLIVATATAILEGLESQIKKITLISPIQSQKQRKQRQRQRNFTCKICKVSAAVPVAEELILCSALLFGWKSQTLRLLPNFHETKTLSVLAGQNKKQDCVLNSSLQVNPELKAASDKPIALTTTTISQTEPHESVVDAKLRLHNTFILSNDYVITLGTTQPGDVKHNIETQSSIPFLVRNRFRTTKSVEEMDLSPGALQILHLPNAGGNSLESEVLSFELLHRCYGAKLLKTEMEIEYFPSYSKKTDYSVTLHGHNVGVSVTRAMKFGSKFTAADADHLLRRKLFGIIISSQNVLERHGWEKQILHVWATHPYVADIIAEQFSKMCDSLRVDTLLVLSVCTSDSLPANVFTSNPNILDYIFNSK